MKLLISGSTGFVGRHLTKRLTKGGHSVYAIVRPSTDVDTLEKEGVKFYVFDGDIEGLIIFMKREKIEGVVHLASLFLSSHKPADVQGLINSNVLFGTALLEASVNSGVSAFINTGTFWQHFDNQEYSPVNLYAATKQAFEDIAKFYTETSSINFVTIKLSDTFGPGDTRDKIFNLWMKSGKTGEPLDMSDGEQLIDISYINNIIDGYEQMITLLAQDKERKFSGKSFAISSNEVVSLRKLADIFEQATQTKLNINWGKKEYRPREIMLPWTEGESIPGWKPVISLREGIKKTWSHE